MPPIVSSSLHCFPQRSINDNPTCLNAKSQSQPHSIIKNTERKTRQQKESRRPAFDSCTKRTLHVQTKVRRPKGPEMETLGVHTCEGAGQPCVVLYTEPGRVHVQPGLGDGLPVVDHLHLRNFLSPSLLREQVLRQTLRRSISVLHRPPLQLLGLIFFKSFLSDFFFTDRTDLGEKNDPCVDGFYSLDRHGF